MADITQNDLWFTEEGDLLLDSDGDLGDTSGIFGRGLFQEIRSNLRSEKGDWELDPDVGAEFSRFLGEAALDFNVNGIIQSIAEALTQNGTLIPGEFEIIHLQLSEEEHMFRVIVYTGRGELTLQLAYDSNTKRFKGY